LYLREVVAKFNIPAPCYKIAEIGNALNKQRIHKNEIQFGCYDFFR
jgi:hypothetical protein